MKRKKKFSIRPLNWPFLLGLSITLLFFVGVTCFSAYTLHKEAMLLHCQTTLDDIEEAYENKAFSLSAIYADVFSSEDGERTLRKYFLHKSFAINEASLRGDLVNILSTMLASDNDIEWIALWNPDLGTNYCLYRNGSRLVELPADFPYAPQQTGYRLRGTWRWQDSNGTEKCSFVVQGGSIPAELNGSILIGYSLDAFERVLRRSTASENTEYLIVAGNEVVFDSSGKRYEQVYDPTWLSSGSGRQKDNDGNSWYISAYHNTGRDFWIAYMLPAAELFWQANEQTPTILAALVLFTGFVIVLYSTSNRRILRRVTDIQNGLVTIGENNLNHRLNCTARNDEFDVISDSINAMTERLQQSVEKEYEMRVRQVQLELSQIQARFNPHFLYNTLEIIRGKLFDNGDLETADYIEKLSRIFRNLTDSRPIVTIQTELAFCGQYAALLQLRFQNAVNVSYDVPDELNDCGILSNLIQPIIENYFVHAHDNTGDNGELVISCVPLQGEKLRIEVSNNGASLPVERLEEVNRNLKEPDLASKSYGLMSIAKRIKLFYGTEYGIHLENGDEEGVRVIIEIARMSLDKHTRKLMMIQ